MSQKGTWSSMSFLGRRKSSQTSIAEQHESDKRRSSLFSRKKNALPVVQLSQSNGVTHEDIEACMTRIRQQLDGLRLQRTDMQRRVEDMNSTLNEIRGECVTRVSLSGSISDLSSIGSFISMSDESSISGLSQCYLVDDDDSSGAECEFDDEASECQSSASSTDTVSPTSLEDQLQESETVNLLEVTQTEYL